MNEGQKIESLFPAIKGHYEIRSKKSTSYNCIAFAAGDNTRNWDGFPIGDDYWPNEAKYGHGIAALAGAFYAIGYRQCEDGDLEEGFERVALYGIDYDSYEHAARQRPDGRWESKMGKLENIIHLKPEHLEGAEYGKVIVFMNRKRVDHEEKEGQKS